MVAGPDRPSDRPVTLAAIAGAHGVRGEVRLKLFADSADSLRQHARFDANGCSLTLQALRETGTGAIARFAEVGDRNAAEALRGTVLSVPRSALPPLAEGEYYWHDLVGLAVVSDDGRAVGTVVSVNNYGASDVLEIERAEHDPLLVPLIPQAAKVEDDRIVIDSAWLA